MPLILVHEGMTTSLDSLVATWGGDRFIGLMQGDLDPLRSWTITQIVKAVFSGYSGEQAVQNWTAAVIQGELAKVTADPVIWAHNGGPASCKVSGYYVVDGNGKLQWAEKFSPPYQAMALATDRAKVTPTFVLGSRFPYP